MCSVSVVTDAGNMIFGMILSLISSDGEINVYNTDFGKIEGSSMEFIQIYLSSSRLSEPFAIFLWIYLS